MIATLLPDDVLDTLAGVADPGADDIVTRVLKDLGMESPDLERRQRVGVFPHLVREIGQEDGRHVGPFLRAGTEVDTFIDADLVRHAQAFFEENGVSVITALFLAALPEAYLGRRGVQVLDMTGELVSNWTRRIAQTGQFLVNVLSPSPTLAKTDRTSLSCGEAGALAARRVRLIHAAIRWLLTAPHRPRFSLLLLSDFPEPTLWQTRMVEIGEEKAAPARGKAPRVFSQPLNQEDLLATLGTFTTVVFEALEKLSVPFNADDRTAFYHLWNVVGWHLGIGDATALRGVSSGMEARSWPGNKILPLEVGEMDALFARLRSRLQGPTEQGGNLATTLVQELSKSLPVGQGAPAFFVRYLIGDERAYQLEISAGGYAELMFRRSGALERLARRTRVSTLGRLVSRPLSQAITRYALRTFVSRSRVDDRGLEISPRIATQWGIQIGPEVRSPSRM
jgi:hypothetical protein